MRIPFRQLLACLSIVMSIGGSFDVVADESYPSRPIRVIYPFPPGGVGDALTRFILEKVSVKLGQPIFVDNKPGATGNVGTEIMAHAKPDGYTLLSTPPPPLVVNQNLYPNLPFDPAKFVPISVLALSSNVLVVNPKVSANSVGELIAQAKASPGKLNYASTGSGGTPHLTMEWFKSAANVDLTHVPYKGVQSYLPLLAGEVDVMFMNIADALPYIRSGKLRVLAIGGVRRNAAIPDVPTLAETIPGFVSVTWFGVVATPGTPAVTAEKLSAAIADALQSPEVKKKLADLHVEPVGGSPAQAGAFFKAETERWAKVINTARIKPD